MERVSVIGRDTGAMADLVRVHGAAVVRQTLRRREDGRWQVQALAEAAELASLEGAGFEVERIEDVGAAHPGLGAAAGGAAAEPGAPVARGPIGYMDVAEVDRRLAALAEPPHTQRTALLTLPQKTWEGRSCYALRIGPGSGPGRPGVCLLGGMHAREWGSADTLVVFAERLLAAYEACKGIAIGRRRFSAALVRRLVDEANLYVCPQVNPDGRHHSFTVDPMWRKNRRPPPGKRRAAVGDECVGVDLNRNFDFLWDFATHFDPAAPISCSTSPCDPQTYVGPSAASEPETRNVIWLLDEHPDIGYLVDLHSYGELIMHSWGDDENQSRRARMAFSNKEYDGRRGTPGEDYKEFIAVADRKRLVRLATKMRSGIAAARGRTYRVQQSMNLYPTSGTSDDYAFSRHLTDPTRSKVLAFTVEWGAEDNPTPFHPPYEEMVQIIAEVTSGLFAFCGDALRIGAATRQQEES
jgi:murein tripeptide amidase MpaA